MTQNMPQKQKTKLVPVSREPALLTERDAGKSPVLECIDLGITFGGLKAVDNFNVTIGRTEITGLIGPNGAGKTTVFNLLTKVYQPTHGTILLNGKDIHDLNTAQVNRAGIARTFQNIRLFGELSVEENSAVRCCVLVKRAFSRSAMEQRIVFYPHTRRIDFITHVDWHEEHALLKAAFPVDVYATRARYDIQFGSIERDTHRNTSWDAARFEVCAHKWADLSEAGYGVALLNDCKYGCRLLGNVIDLALLRAPKYPDWDADRGDHTFTYSFLPHANGAVDSEVRAEALRLNRPPQRFDGLAGSAELPVRVEAKQVELAALKKAEKEDCAVVRLVERGGRHSSAVLHTACRLVETGLTEWEDGAELTPVDGRIVVTFRPFEIKTFKLKK